jgi:hypothetical protein
MLLTNSHTSGRKEALQELLSQVGKLNHFFIMHVGRLRGM